MQLGYERVEHKPDFKTVIEIAEYLEGSTDYLLGRSVEPTVFLKEDEDFEVFTIDSTLQKWYKDLPDSKEEDLPHLPKMQ